MTTDWNLDRWSLGRKWSWVAGTFLVALGINYVSGWKDWDAFSPLWLYFIPLVLSALLLNSLATLLGVLSVLVLALLSLVTANEPLWPFLTFLGAVGTNAFFWHRWNQAQEFHSFGFQKTQEDLELSLNETRIAQEKAKVALQANQVKIQRYTALNELARSLAMTFKTQEVVVLLIETISKTFMVPGGVYTLLLFDGPLGKALHSVRYSVDTDMEVRLNRERLNPEETFNTWVLSQGKPLLIGDALSDFRFQNHTPEGRVRSLVCAPLMAGNEVMGLIRMESCYPGAYRQEDARLLSNFCDLGIVALEHVALYRQTIELAITDGLTGLYVQRYYKERVRDEVFRALEHKLPLCLMMIDVDNFKTYNDTYGHQVGDKVLQSVARVLKETVRTVDLVARYGGEEFSVLVLKTPWSGAKTVAERIRQKIEEQEIVAGQQVTHVTVSIGVSELDPRFKNVEEFIDTADQGLYQAKAEGKNRVRLAKWGGNP